MYKVLIVEDDFRIAEINKAFVEKIDGFKVIGIALNGASFKSMMEETKPDLVLLDVYIPDISGEDLLLHIKKNYPKTDVIMITAAKEVKTLEFFLKHGIFDYLIKPVHADRLNRSLRKYLMYKEKINQNHEVEQKDIDAILDRSLSVQQKEEVYPKGIDPLTLERVRNFLQKPSTEITAEEAGKVLGMSRSTARRYLDYLARKNEIVADLRYGTVGRPERIYRTEA